MDTKKFEALLSSAELGSFTKSAQELGYTQSGLTHMMNGLEQEVGFPLLERGHYGTRLTARGQQLEPTIRRFLEAGQDLSSEIESIRRQESLWVRVGAYSSMAQNWLPSVMQQFRQEFPNIQVDIQMGAIEEIYEWVRNGEVDMGFVSRQDDLKGDFFHLKNDPLVAVLPQDVRFNSWNHFPVEEFEGREFLLPSLGFNRDIMPVFKKHRVHPKIRKTTVDDSVVISMVAHGLGVSIMTDLIMVGRQEAVKILPIAPAAHRDLGIVVRNKKETKAAVQSLIACASRVIPAL